MTTNSFSALKRNRTNSLDKLKEETKKLTSNGREADDRFWRPTVDKAGNGMATIRFLPAADGEDLPWVRVFSHAFQGPGGWYIENSLTTLGKDDPVSELNKQLWATGIDANKKIVSKQKRKLQYIANIYVVKDPGNTDNEGKVFLFKFGKKIFDMLNDKMSPQFEDEEAMNPFDLWEGANFKLKQRKVDDYPNYDKSEFEASGVLGGFDDAKLETIWKSQYKLSEFTEASNFKSYDVLKARLDKVLAGVASETTAEDDEVDVSKPTRGRTASPRKAVVAEPEEAPWEGADGDEDPAAFFSKIMEED